MNMDHMYFHEKISYLDNSIKSWDELFYKFYNLYLDTDSQVIRDNCKYGMASANHSICSLKQHKEDLIGEDND